MSARVETISVALIAVVVLIGGRSFLGTLLAHHVAAAIVLTLLAALQFFAVRRNYTEGGGAVRVRATRDVAFLSAIIFALILVSRPQHWAVGATIAAVEFGLVLDLLARYVPEPR